MKVFDRVDIGLILKKHVETFYNDGEEKSTGIKNVPVSDKVVFIYFPIITSILIVALGITLTNDYINIIITSLSIFVGLLFNLLVLVFDLAKKQREKIERIEDTNEIVPKTESAKYNISKELFANISFAIALSIFAIIATVFPSLKPTAIVVFVKSNICNFHVVKVIYLAITNVIAITLVIEFLLVLLMILKRFFLIFNTEVN
jgi:hypothetical protein